MRYVAHGEPSGLPRWVSWLNVPSDVDDDDLAATVPRRPEHLISSNASKNINASPSVHKSLPEWQLILHAPKSHAATTSSLNLRNWHSTDECRSPYAAARPCSQS
jgi:hypothetical protein